ncbi:MAG: dihydrofolate reductase family protein [bacterium]|nr:dihydrofolate reductase family protein [bacterium]
MSEIIYYVAASLDGYITDAQKSVAFLDRFGDPSDTEEGAEDYGYHRLLEDTEAVIMGANTYQFIQGQGDYPYPEHRSYIFTSQSLKAPAQGQLVHTDPVDYCQQLKRWEDRPIWLVGGGQLAGALLEARLIDRLRLFVAPVTLGAGTPLFGAYQGHFDWQLIDSKAYPSGLVEMHYQPL